MRINFFITKELENMGNLKSKCNRRNSLATLKLKIGYNIINKDK